MKKYLFRLLVTLVFVVFLSIPFSVPVLALTTADVVVTATPSYVAITCNATALGYDFGVVATSSTTNTTTAYFNINNTSTVQTDQTISVTSANWSGGDAWGHNDAGTANVTSAALKAQLDGAAWGSGTVVTVKNIGPDFIYENCAIGVDYDFGLSLLAPTAFTDGVQKQITLRVTAVAG